ncbi:DNA-processing protein DprA [Oleispirillum naphthae]|uniref:DNA-processing protein DprA n=1 Tax=Oleispirillum naphthae TaxID=2838853 RepID=UPI00308252D6
MNAPPITQLTPENDLYPGSVVAAFNGKAPTLWCQGNLSLLTKPGVGFCGSRKASDKGLETARDCAEQACSLGISVISGNAAGVDFIAHRTTLEAGGTTILALPEGIDHFRIRKEFQPIWDWNRVLVISQFTPDAAWKVYRAMDRNTLIIALSRAMIVIEAGEKGGTLNAGLTTLSLSKPLFVAVYEQARESALGNTILIGKGGIPLARNRSTGRANLKRVQEAIEGQWEAPASYGQPSLF